MLCSSGGGGIGISFSFAGCWFLNLSIILGVQIEDRKHVRKLTHFSRIKMNDSYPEVVNTSPPPLLPLLVTHRGRGGGGRRR
uniref:Uncharacterized protein n=1 Tax=Arundo donax TaxID=35708 RepID=A0A0A9G9A1_ARUDO